MEGHRILVPIFVGSSLATLAVKLIARFDLRKQWHGTIPWYEF